MRKNKGKVQYGTELDLFPLNDQNCRHDRLRRNLPEVTITSGQKTLYKLVPRVSHLTAPLRDPGNEVDQSFCPGNKTKIRCRRQTLKFIWNT